MGLIEVVEADEEARGRVDAARKDAQRMVSEARAAREAADRARLDGERQALERELKAIADAAGAQVSERRARREAWLKERARAAEARIDEAAAEWIRIVLGDEP